MGLNLSLCTMYLVPTDVKFNSKGQLLLLVDHVIWIKQKLALFKNVLKYLTLLVKLISFYSTLNNTI